MKSKHSSKTSVKRSRKNAKRPPKLEEVFLEVLSPSALYGAGNQKAPHPLEEMSVDKILYYLEKFKAKYPNFDELNIEFTMGPAEFGGMNWWELRGIRTV